MPKVSVIIPNYNHARYLPQRIDSVLNQTFTDFELLMLDDCSPDNSLEVIAEYAEKDARIKVYPNEKNSGSTFAQWNKGVSLAKGEYIWLAESDDYCECTLLERLVALLDEHPNLGIAYAQSALVDEEGKFIKSFNEEYKLNYQSNRWESDFIVNGKEEVANYLLISNTIPNASGALMRKSVYDLVGGPERGWRLNGDWFFYVKMLLQSDLAYVADHLNYFRWHRNTQSHKSKANDAYILYDEIIYIIEYIKKYAEVKPETLSKAYRTVAGWWVGSLPRKNITRDYVVHNWRLYRFFRKKRPRIEISIIGNMLDWMGIRIRRTTPQRKGATQAE